jgi:hypothetical protein
LKVEVESESDVHGLVGAGGRHLENLRITVYIASKGTDETALRELVAAEHRMSPVSATLGMQPAVALDVKIG